MPAPLGPSKPTTSPVRSDIDTSCTRWGTGGAAVNREFFSGVFVIDDGARHLIGQGVAPKAAHDCIGFKAHRIGLAVVNQGFGFALDKFVQAFALLPEKSALFWGAGDGAKLVAFGVLAYFDFGAADYDSAFGGHDFAAKHRDLLRILVAHAVGLYLHGLVAVGFFSPGAWQQPGAKQCAKD